MSLHSEAPDQTAIKTPDPRTSADSAALEASTQMPGWFRRKLALKREKESNRAARRAAIPPPIVIDPDEPDEELSWQQRFVKSMRGEGGVSFLVSLLTHAVLFGVLLVLLHLLGLRFEGAGVLSPIAALFEEDKPNAPFEEVETEIELNLGFDDSQLAEAATVAPTEATAFVPEIPFDPTLELRPDTFEDFSGDLLEEVGGAFGDAAKNGGFSMPVNKKKVVTKGSFSVWTNPEDPKPFENYLIIIQLNTRVRIRKLSKDLSGTIVGTDRYFDKIASGRGIPKARQWVVWVPGALKKVRDTIKVHSKRLKETQTIEIEF